MNKIRVAVIGYGHLGKWHCQKVEACSDLADFVAIVERYPQSQELAKKNHPQVKVVGDVEEVLHEIDAAFIVTPTSTHFELAKILLKNQKHIFCEKPVCSTNKEAVELTSLAKDNKSVFQVGHSERFHKVWEILKGEFKTLRSPYHARLTRVAAFKGRATDVDVIQDLAIHDLDLMLYLFSQSPVRLKTKALKIRTQNLDHAAIHVDLEEGSTVEIIVSRNHVKEMRELEVISQDGMIFVDLMNNKYSKAHSSHFEDGTFVQDFSYEKRDHLLLEHQAFYKSIQTSAPPVVSLEDGVRAVRLIDLSLRSFELNKELDVEL